ncbi:hypothetical protein PVAG01_07815 [Phlyctema vagabunda]|uniref:Uncharacterized protein n=1 Tax=Phlyctema vagabunda TaxID=108571 RepID=A0ABR4PDM1_9HELO
MRALGVSVSLSRRLTTSTNINNTNQESQNPSSTATRTRPSRTPLQPRDENAMIARVPPKAKASQPLASKNGNANMPFDKQNAPSRPLMPALGVNSKSSRPPITPRVAGSTSAATATPSARKGARTDRSERNPTPTGSREDAPVLASSYLSSNVTPRSGSRKSRVESPAGTPTGTPTPQSVVEAPRIATEPVGYNSGLGVGGMERDGPRRPNVSFNSEVSYQNSSAPSAPDSKFFFASDVKSGANPPVRPGLQKQSSSSFFYANGDSIPPPSVRSGGSTVGSSLGDDLSQSKFFHANGTPDIITSPSPQFSAPRSTISNSSRITSPRLAPASTTSTVPYQRPNSPQKLSQNSAAASQKHVTGRTSPAFNRSIPTSAPRGTATQGNVVARRSSIESAPRNLGHSRSGSLGTAEVRTPPTRKISYGESQVLSPAGAFALSPVSASTPEEFHEGADDTLKADLPSGLQSPTKAGHSIEHMNELAANARRERKVLDLEITNSSLEAINRTLEREMRKQTAELRRYRRMSRTGRLSINTTASTRTSTESHSLMSLVDGTQFSDMSEEESFSEQDISEEESADDASLSSAALAESDARHRSKDEKRLQLDLAKHQQLLTDSQKMNQSLKRCLGWTEELITEGKKALEYHVRVSDVELGGRVLAPEYTAQRVEDDHEVIEALASPLLKEVMKAAAWGDEGRDGRDSGIELNPENGLHRGMSPS